MDNIQLINVSDLKKLLESGKALKLIAESFKAETIYQSSGYILKVECEALENHQPEEYTVSTYLSDKVKLYKRADALLKEARQCGFTEVNFKLDVESPETEPSE